MMQKKAPFWLSVVSSEIKILVQNFRLVVSTLHIFDGMFKKQSVKQSLKVVLALTLIFVFLTTFICPLFFSVHSTHYKGEWIQKDTHGAQVDFSHLLFEETEETEWSSHDLAKAPASLPRQVCLGENSFSLWKEQSSVGHYHHLPIYLYTRTLLI
jgi:hypothetical protein